MPTSIQYYLVILNCFLRFTKLFHQAPDIFFAYEENTDESSIVEGIS